MKNIRSFLKWPGNKYQLLNTILPIFPKGQRLIEPFAGSCSVFINSHYSSYLIAEKNKDLVSLYHFIKENGEAFIEECKTYFIQEYNNKDIFYKLRTLFNETTDPKKRAILFLYLNRHGYNGLCRYNNSGLFNVPFGSKPKAYFPLKELRYFHLKSQSATFLQADFTKTFSYAKLGDVIYCDPPYAPLSKTASFAQYTDGHFTEKEHILLTELAIISANKGIPVLISNHDTPFTRKQYQHAEIKTFQARRSISSKVESRGKVPELLAVFR